MAKSLNQVEREYLVGKGIGMKSQLPLVQADSVYKGSFSSSKTRNKGSQIAWLKHVITANGGTPTSKYIADLAIQAVRQIGKTPSKFLNDNLRLLYLNNA